MNAVLRSRNQKRFIQQLLGKEITHIREFIRTAQTMPTVLKNSRAFPIKKRLIGVKSARHALRGIKRAGGDRSESLAQILCHG